jgi:DHA1 family bicyclomycin/chloramphenicol resistance-like MFS transporter
MTNQRGARFVEFIILVSLMFSLIAFGTDSMLPALPQIAADLKLADPNQAQLVVTVFVLGTGLGQLFFGPLSDATGRKPAIGLGIGLFIVGCVICYYVQSIEWMLLGRFIQGLGISGPRTVTIALVRDIYKGRRMAQVMSFTFGVFVLVPAIAPWLGQQIMGHFGWRSIYLSFMIFAAVVLVWLWLRQAETHPVDQRRMLSRTEFATAIKDVLGNRTVVTFMLIQGLLLGGLFAYLSSAQQVFVESFDVGADFPLYFATITLLSGIAAFINGTLVMRLGMHRMVQTAIGLALVSAVLSLVFQTLAPQSLRLSGFVVWSVISFLMMSLSLGNLNALAMDPMGHIAGLASAIIGASATLLAVLLAIPIGLAFNGSPLPLMAGHLGLYALAFWLLKRHPV